MPIFNRSKKSVQTTLQLVFFFLIVTSFLAYISYFVYSESKKIQIQAFETLSRDAQNASAFMDEEIKSVSTVMQNIAYSNLIMDRFIGFKNNFSHNSENYTATQNIKILTDLLTSIIGPSKPVDQIYLYSLDEGYIGVGLDTGVSGNVSIKDKPWYDSLINSNSNKLIFCSEEPGLKKYFTYQEGSYFLSVCSIYQSSYYNPLGVIEVKHSMSSLISRLRKIDTGTYNEKVYLFDQRGNNIYDFSHDGMGTKYYDFLSDYEKQLEDNGDTPLQLSFDDNTHLFVTRSPYSGFTTIIAADNHDLYKPIMDYIKANLFIFMIFVIVILFLSYVVSRIITTPLMKMYSNIANLHTDEESLLTESLDEVNTDIIELDTLYSAVVKMHEKTKTSMKREIALNNQRLQSQILALQSQMNPHFLYNSLATISAMADEGMNEEVTRMCQTISRILRYISSDKDPLVSIEEDVTHARDYLECMKMRYGDNLIYEIDLPPEMSKIKIPKLCLQLIVENSIKFATKSVKPPWRIKMSGVMTGIYWEISVKDNGTGFSTEDLKEINEKIDSINETDLLPDLEINGMGLMNIYIRFKTLYHGKHIFRISNNAEGGALVTIGGEFDANA